MTAEDCGVRRATVDDLAVLKALWNSMRLPADELEKRLTEFQVVESADGRLVGSIGVQIVRPHARLHSEAYPDFAVADDARTLLLKRIQSLASNHGVFRLWTQETAPFWTRYGFQAASPDTLKKLPEVWAGLGSAWLTLQLKDEAAIVSLEKELAMFMEAEKATTARALARARTIKRFATLIAIVLAIFVLGTALYLARRNPELLLGK